jgi:hypothetical protein
LKAADMKLFISHKWEDTRQGEWVKKLCSDLILKYNIECLLDVFQPVESITSYMQKIHECDVILIILTKSCVESLNSNTGNIFYETSIAIAQNTKNKLRIIPILKEDTDIAKILCVYRYIDFRNAQDYESKLQELSDAIFLKPFMPGTNIGSKITPPNGIVRPRPREKYKTFSDEEISKLGHLIHKLKAKDSTGRWAYYFLLVPPDCTKSFLDNLNGDGTIDIEDYGVVIASSYGEVPTKEVKAYLKNRYGFDV